MSSTQLTDPDVAEQTSAADGDLFYVESGGIPARITKANALGVTSAEMGYLSGVTSGIQAQIDAATTDIGAAQADITALQDGQWVYVSLANLSSTATAFSSIPTGSLVHFCQQRLFGRGQIIGCDDFIRLFEFALKRWYNQGLFLSWKVWKVFLYLV